MAVMMMTRDDWQGESSWGQGAWRAQVVESKLQSQHAFKSQRRAVAIERNARKMHDLSCNLVHARGELAICTGELANVYKQNENMVMELAEAREQVAHANKYNEEKSKELDTAHEQQRCMSLEIADLQDQLRRLLEYNWALREELDVIMDPEDLLIKTAEIAFTSAIRQTVGLHSVLDCALSVSMVSDKPWPVDVPCISVGDESVDYTNGDLVELVKTECHLYEKQSEPLYWKLRHAVMLAEDLLGQGWEKGTFVRTTSAA